MFANRDNLLESLVRLTTRLSEWRESLERNDAGALERLLAEAKRIRDSAGT